jgi:hypothetical protein
LLGGKNDGGFVGIRQGDCGEFLAWGTLDDGIDDLLHGPARYRSGVGWGHVVDDR